MAGGQGNYPQQPGGHPPQQGGQQQGGYPQQQGGYPQQGGQPYGQQGYQQPGPYGHNPGSGSIPGIVIAGFILSFLCPLIGVILCAVGLGEAKKRNAGVGLATAGIIVGGILFVINLGWFVGMRA